MEGLFRLSKDDEVIEAGAQKYEVSKDGKTYTFHLRDAKWSNGDPVTAQDYVHAWKQLINGYSFSICIHCVRCEKCRENK